MSQERLNHILLLHTHKVFTDELNVVEIAKELIKVNDRRQSPPPPNKNGSYTTGASFLEGRRVSCLVIDKTCIATKDMIESRMVLFNEFIKVGSDLSLCIVQYHTRGCMQILTLA